MAFGFFKKNETADAIFTGGRIFTQNPDFPWVDAVACKDGMIFDVGEYEDLADLEGKHTKVIDLAGRVMLPGYIDVCGHQALSAFKESCLFLKDGGLEDVLAQISEYASAHGGADIIFAYGYEEDILTGVEPEAARSLLDEVCADCPVVVLGKSGFHCFVNNLALETVRAAAEEDEVKTVTVSYLLGVLDPLNLTAIPAAVPAAMGNYCERGFTAVFDCGAPEFFASVYQNTMVHLYQEDMLKQRFYGSLLINRDVNPKAVMQKLSQFRTHCAELNGYINFQTLKLVVSGTGENFTISEEVLEALCLEAGDRGFDVHIDTWGEDAVDAAVDAMSATRSAGYKKSAFTLVHDQNSGSNDLTDTCYHLDITEIIRDPSTTDGEWLCIESAKSVEEAIEMLTINAAQQLGISADYGSIEKGKSADFAIFDENPFDAKTLSDFKKLKAAMTVIGGAVVYDAEKDDFSSWNLTLNQPEEE